MTQKDDILYSCTGFEWDEGNLTKSWLKHDVAPEECEQVFFNQPLMAMMDEKHSQQELRHNALGRTNDDRKLYIVFTIRRGNIRVISARDMNRKERKVYE